mmetsp:Transcript_2879/g.4197  ORF Transcript_2879/g.4197 Transcript_2879/m.4197 type:complete len:1291 (-) Transcript_2879:196-4068(-)
MTSVNEVLRTRRENGPVVTEEENDEEKKTESNPCSPQREPSPSNDRTVSPSKLDHSKRIPSPLKKRSVPPLKGRRRTPSPLRKGPSPLKGKQRMNPSPTLRSARHGRPSPLRAGCMSPSPMRSSLYSHAKKSKNAPPRFPSRSKFRNSRHDPMHTSGLDSSAHSVGNGYDDTLSYSAHSYRKHTDLNYSTHSLPSGPRRPPTRRNISTSSVASAASRDGLRSDMQRRHASLTKSELQFLDELLEVGGDEELDMARSKLADEELFFDPLDSDLLPEEDEEDDDTSSSTVPLHQERPPLVITTSSSFTEATEKTSKQHNLSGLVRPSPLKQRTYSTSVAVNYDVEEDDTLLPDTTMDTTLDTTLDADCDTVIPDYEEETDNSKKEVLSTNQAEASVDKSFESTSTIRPRQSIELVHGSNGNLTLLQETGTTTQSTLAYHVTSTNSTQPTPSLPEAQSMNDKNLTCSRGCEQSAQTSRSSRSSIAQSFPIGSERRRRQMERRSSSALHEGLWKAHESGLTCSNHGSRRSISLRNSLGASGHGNGFLLEPTTGGGVNILNVSTSGRFVPAMPTIDSPSLVNSKSRALALQQSSRGDSFLSSSTVDLMEEGGPKKGHRLNEDEIFRNSISSIDRIEIKPSFDDDDDEDEESFTGMGKERLTKEHTRAATPSTMRKGTNNQLSSSFHISRPQAIRHNQRRASTDSAVSISSVSSFPPSIRMAAPLRSESILSIGGGSHFSIPMIQHGHPIRSSSNLGSMHSIPMIQHANAIGSVLSSSFHSVNGSRRGSVLSGSVYHRSSLLNASYHTHVIDEEEQGSDCDLDGARVKAKAAFLSRRNVYEKSQRYIDEPEDEGTEAEEEKDGPAWSAPGVPPPPRTIMLRSASFGGEGFEVAEIFSGTAGALSTGSVGNALLQIDSIGNARNYRSLVSSNTLGGQSERSCASQSTMFGSDWRGLHVPDNASEAFQSRDTHSFLMSDSGLQDAFISGGGFSSRPLDGPEQSNSLLPESHQLSASWDLDSDSDNEGDDRQDAWNVLRDEYAIGYGANGTLPFLILGTSADDIDSTPHVLSPPLMESLQSFLPFAKSEDNFWMKYSMARDGASLHTLLQHIRGATHTILAIETVDGEVMGSFTSAPWRKNWNYFGTGESFLWRMRQDRNTPCYSIIDQAQLESELDVYPWTGANDCVQLCTQNKIAVGGGNDLTVDMATPFGSGSEAKQTYNDDNTQYGFGLAIESDLLHATSSRCATFGSPALSRYQSDGSPMEIINLEVWALTPSMSSDEAEKLELGKLFLEDNYC